MTRSQMFRALEALGLVWETFGIDGIGGDVRVRQTSTGDYLTDHPDLIGGRYISWAEFDIWAVGFFAGRNLEVSA